MKSKLKKSKKRKKDPRCATGPRKKCKADVCPATSNDKNDEKGDDEMPAPFEEDSGIDSNIEKYKRPVVNVPESVDAQTDIIQASNNNQQRPTGNTATRFENF